MIKFGKIEDGKIKPVYIKLNPIWMNGVMYANPSENIIEKYKKELFCQGIKPIKVADMPEIIDDYKLDKIYTDLGEYILQDWKLVYDPIEEYE